MCFINLVKKMAEPAGLSRSNSLDSQYQTQSTEKSTDRSSIAGSLSADKTKTAEHLGKVSNEVIEGAPGTQTDEAKPLESGSIKSEFKNQSLLSKMFNAVKNFFANIFKSDSKSQTEKAEGNTPIQEAKSKGTQQLHGSMTTYVKAQYSKDDFFKSAFRSDVFNERSNVTIDLGGGNTIKTKDLATTDKTEMERHCRELGAKITDTSKLPNGWEDIVKSKLKDVDDPKTGLVMLMLFQASQNTPMTLFGNAFGKNTELEFTKDTTKTEITVDLEKFSVVANQEVVSFRPLNNKTKSETAAPVKFEFDCTTAAGICGTAQCNFETDNKGLGALLKGLVK